MGFFDFLKPKKNKAVESARNILYQVFPKGELDYQVGTQEILDILNNKVDNNTATNIFVKTVIRSRVEEAFNKEILLSHLKGYCIELFNENQVERLHQYLVALIVASKFEIAPSSVKRSGTGYSW